MSEQSGAEVDSDVPEPGIQPRGTRLLPLSGKSEVALRELAGRYLAWLDERDGELSADGAASEAVLADMAWTAGVGRSHFDDRAAVVFRDTESLREGLEAVAGTGDRPARGTATRIAFAYTGQGSQWVGMGRALYESEPVARAVMDRCEAVFREERGTSLLDVMFGRDGANGDLGDTAWEQPALYTIESALTGLWASVGIRPDVVLGHSVGEIAAAHAAGVFSLEDGMRFACTRGALMSGMEEGAMAAVFAPADRVAAAVADWNAASGDMGVSISGDNGAHQVVSGPVDAVEAVSKRFESEEIRVRRLNTAKAFHSALVDPILDALEASLDGVAIASPSLTLVSNLTGRAVVPDLALDGSYWRRHAREAVAFSSGVRTVANLGVDLLVEIGPRSVLAPMALTAWPEEVEAPAVLASLQAPSADDPLAGGAGDFVRAVAEAYETGLPVRFEGLFAGESRRRISLPGYPFQRTRHWLDAPRRRRGRADHPLLGTRHESAGGETTFETEVFPAEPAWLDDHRVYRRVVVPGALYGAMAAAVSRTDGRGPVVVEEMQLHNALVFPEDGSGNGSGDAGRTLQMVLDASEGAATRDFRIFSKGSEGEWVVHVEGRVAPGTAVPEADGRIDLEGLKARLSPVDVAATTAPGWRRGSTWVRPSKRWPGPGPGRARQWARWPSRRISAGMNWMCIPWCSTVASRLWGRRATLTDRMVRSPICPSAGSGSG